MACKAAFQRFPLNAPLLNSSAFATSLGISYASRHFPRAFRFQAYSVQPEAKIEAMSKTKDETHSSIPWRIKMLYDGDCPLCMREVNMLKERNKHYGAIKFVDISSAAYSPKENLDLDYKTVMGRIHAILSDGTVVRDVEAFRRLYEEVGLGWVYAITKYEPIATIAQAIYAVWAKYRLKITGRPELDQILELRKKTMGETCNNNETCRR